MKAKTTHRKKPPKKKRKRKPPHHSLTQRQRNFCREYAIHGDAQKAALSAGYSKSYAEHKAFALVVQSRVAAELQRLAELAEDAALPKIQEADGILAECMRATTEDFEKILQDGTRIWRPTPDQKNKHALNTIKSRYHIEGDKASGQQAAVVSEFKLESKLRALDIFYRRKGAYAPEKHLDVTPSTAKKLVEELDREDAERRSQKRGRAKA